MREVVVDTNVWAVADDQHPDVSVDCMERCQVFLETLRSDRLLAVDARDGDPPSSILHEYRRNVRSGGYYEKLLGHLQSRNLLRYVTPSLGEADGPFAVGGPLCEFDRDDRKFVAVAVQSNPPRPVFNATDTDWSEHEVGLRKLGVTVHELCPCDLQTFRGAEQ